MDLLLQVPYILVVNVPVRVEAQWRLRCLVLPVEVHRNSWLEVAPERRTQRIKSWACCSELRACTLTWS